MTMVTGLFSTRRDAERAYQSVIERGYQRADINLIMSDKTRDQWFPVEHQTETDLTAKVAEGGIEPLLRWIAFISANIGFLNLLPIPVLDGGHLVYYAIEGVLRRPMSRRMQEIGFQIGVALVLMLMVYVNLNDLLRVWRGWTGAG